MPKTITIEEARARFGELQHKPTRTLSEFEDPDGGGIWRPVYVEGELIGYRLYQLHKVQKRRWTTPRR